MFYVIEFFGLRFLFEVFIFVVVISRIVLGKVF